MFLNEINIKKQRNKFKDMCGIAGIIQKKNIGTDRVNEFVTSCKLMHHRGPDYFGVETYENVTLIHLRKPPIPNCCPVSDYSMPNVNEKMVRIILSYTSYIKRADWNE